VRELLVDLPEVLIVLLASRIDVEDAEWPFIHSGRNHPILI
jgi:hypothetical protein